MAVDDDAAVVAAPDRDGAGGVSVVADATGTQGAALVAGGLASVAEDVGEPVEGDPVGHALTSGK